MRRFVFASLGMLALGACQKVYPMLMVDPSDAGQHTTGATTGIGGTGDGGGSNADMDSGMAPIPRGLILVHSGSASLVRATFGDDGCAITSLAGCTVKSCPPVDLAMTMRAAGVGTITISGTTPTITLMPFTDGSYLPQAFPAPIWGMGARLTVAASGGDFAAFSTMVDGPTSVVVTNPLSGGFIDVARNADFDVSWTGGTSGKVTVEIAGGTKLVSCSFTLAANSGLMPRQALSQLPAGTGQMNIYVTSSATVAQGIQVVARTAAEDNTGNVFATGVSLQ